MKSFVWHRDVARCSDPQPLGFNFRRLALCLVQSDPHWGLGDLVLLAEEELRQQGDVAPSGG